MDKEKQAPWMSVPQFGDWDQKGGVPDYSMDFSKIREMRKQNKRDPSRASLGNEDEFGTNNKPQNNHNQVHQQPHHHLSHEDHHEPLKHSPTGRRSFMSYFNCCVKA